MSRCANCGAAEVEGVLVLKSCSACHLVKYCSIKCQKEHRPKHKRDCKERAAELKDKILFKQPEGSHMDDCPICFLPIPLQNDLSRMTVCCSKKICMGCTYFNAIRERKENLPHKCPFCRQRSPESAEESLKILKDRAAIKCPVAMRQVGNLHYQDGDFPTAVDFYTRAAEKDDAVAHKMLGEMYNHGKGVERNLSKAIYHTEKSAIAGHPVARNNLGAIELNHGRYDRAVKHWMIAAKAGYDEALENIKKSFKHGLVSKDDFAAALRSHQDAVDATKSPQREEAAEFQTSRRGF